MLVAPALPTSALATAMAFALAVVLCHDRVVVLVVVVIAQQGAILHSIDVMSLQLSCVEGNEAS
jgi:hypothetical protein